MSNNNIFPKSIVLVDPRSSTKDTIETFKKYGYEVIVLMTGKTEFHSSLEDYKKAGADETIEWDEIAKLENKAIDIVICGSEHSLPEAEDLQRKLMKNVALNDQSIENSRNDKAVLGNLLLKKESPYALKQITAQAILKELDVNLTADDRKRLRTEILNQFQGKSVIIKPTNGAGSEGIKKCDNITQAIDHILLLNQGKVMDQDIKDILIQEFAEGEEYVVNFSSYNGQHVLTGVHKYTYEEINDIRVFKSAEPVYDSQISNQLSKAGKDIVEISGTKTGFSHLEFKMDKHGNIKLIELNPRVAGGNGCLSKMEKFCFDTSQVNAFCNLIQGKTPTDAIWNKKYAKTLLIPAPTEGYRAVDADKIAALKFQSAIIAAMEPEMPASTATKPLLNTAVMVVTHAATETELEKKENMISKITPTLFLPILPRQTTVTPDTIFFRHSGSVSLATISTHGTTPTHSPG